MNDHSIPMMLHFLTLHIPLYKSTAANPMVNRSMSIWLNKTHQLPSDFSMATFSWICDFDSTSSSFPISSAKSLPPRWLWWPIRFIKIRTRLSAMKCYILPWNFLIHSSPLTCAPGVMLLLHPLLLLVVVSTASPTFPVVIIVVVTPSTPSTPRALWRLAWSRRQGRKKSWLSSFGTFGTAPVVVPGRFPSTGSSSCGYCHGVDQNHQERDNRHRKQVHFDGWCNGWFQVIRKGLFSY